VLSLLVKTAYMTVHGCSTAV